MFYINKIVGWMLSPLGILFLGFGLAWGLRKIGMRKSSKIGERLVTTSVWLVKMILVLIWVMSCGVTTRFVGASLEQEWSREGQRHGEYADLPTADAIVVLGGGMGLHPKCKAPEMFGAADRVWQGARLYKAGKAPLVVLSGHGVKESTIPLLRDFGVPEDVVRMFPSARNTEEESKLTYASLHSENRDVRPRILLVTSAWHMSRAKLLFDRAGFDVVPAPTDFEMSYVLERPVSVEDFFPSSEVLTRNSYAIKEWIGNIGYRLLRR